MTGHTGTFYSYEAGPNQRAYVASRFRTLLTTITLAPDTTCNDLLLREFVAVFYARWYAMLI